MNVALWSCLSVSCFLLASATEIVEDCLSEDQIQDCGDCCKIDYSDCSCQTESAVEKIFDNVVGWFNRHKPSWMPGPKHDDSDAKVVVCYFTNWAWYRSGVGKYSPENIDPELCTHIIYAFASLDATTYNISVFDSWPDLDNHFYHNVTSLKGKGKVEKVLIAIGGWNNSVGQWNIMMASEELRRKFVASVLEFLKKYNFDGLDMDYEYPGCPQGVRSADSLENAKNFNKLIKELKEAFKKGGYILTLAASAGKATLEECYYDVGSLCEWFDIINIMGYDYKSASDGYVSANAPFCGTGDSWGVYETINYYTKVLKCPARKLVLGVPLYGHTFTLDKEGDYKWGAKVTGAGSPGPYTGNAGTLAYYEICLKIKEEGWREGFSRVNSSYIHNATELVSYDSPEALQRKVCLILKYGLKGVMVWALDYDDFTGENCDCGKYPLLNTLNTKLFGTHS